MIEFALAVFFLIITPGPGVLSTAGVGSAFGYKPGLRYVTGLFIGTNMVALLVVSGVAAIVFSVPVVRTVLLIASVFYLLYLAAKIAFSGAKIAFIHPDRPPGIRDALILQAINPKAYAVNSAMFLGFPFMQNFWTEIAVKFVIMNAIWIPIHLLWLWFGVVLRSLDLAPAMQRAINMGMAAAMVAVVVLALFSLR